MDASQIRLKARESLKGNYWYAVLAALIAGFFGALMTSGGTVDLNLREEFSGFYEDLPNFIRLYLMLAMGTAGAISSLLTVIVESLTEE